MKIYTRTGDAGTTGLFGGPRVAKDDDRIEAYGTVDELNAVIGIARATGLSDPIDQALRQVQHELFSIGAELATPDPEAFQLRLISADHIARLENWIDQYESLLPPLKTFVLPAGHLAATQLHLARAICRRAERRVVRLSHHPEADVADTLVIYLNRLSDLLFVLCRVANQQAGIPDAPWVKPEVDTSPQSPGDGTAAV
ncbi:MAG: cob(I)yrinic acid a,c-diamide adenosyltransferase [Planctomycetota bacterium]